MISESTIGTALQYTVTSLLSGTKYYFVVGAIDGSGNESAYSNEFSYTPF